MTEIRTHIGKTVRSIIGETATWRIKALLEKFSHLHRLEITERAAFYKQFVTKGDLCFDIGANIGNRVGPLLALGARVIAVEPNKNCCKMLRGRFGNRIEIVGKGLGNQVGIKKFYISNESTLSTFSEEWIESVNVSRFSEFSWEETTLTEITTLDNMIVEYGLPAFIKIDVEGYELEVLQGLSHAIKMISFEYTVPEMTHKIAACINEVASISSNVSCNYSTGETMQWAQSQWMDTVAFLKYIQTDEFLSTGFGDVYIRHDNRTQ